MKQGLNICHLIRVAPLCSDLMASIGSFLFHPHTMAFHADTGTVDLNDDFITKRGTANSDIVVVLPPRTEYEAAPPPCIDTHNVVCRWALSHGIEIAARNTGILDGVSGDIYVVDYILQDETRHYIACLFYRCSRKGVQRPPCLAAHIHKAHVACMRDANFWPTPIILHISGSRHPRVFASSPCMQQRVYPHSHPNVCEANQVL